MIRGIHHVGVHVRDLERMTKFYREAFGFEIVLEHSWKDDPVTDRVIDVSGSAARMCMMRAGTCYIELFQYSAPEPVSTRRLRPFDKGYTHLCVDVTDIDEEYERLRGAGMTFGDRAPIDLGLVKTIYGYDPEGGLIEIQQTVDDCGIHLNQLPPIRA
jgi:catechol 2,3-dioxygenase-like lactoylglutathione lyase family enzyme